MLTALLLLVVTGCFQSLPLHISFLGSRIRVPSRFPPLAHFLGGFISSHHDSFPGAGPRPHLISTFTFTAFVLLPLLFPPFFLSTTLLFPPSLPSFSPPPQFLVLEIKYWTSCMPGKCSTIELSLCSSVFILRQGLTRVPNIVLNSS